MNRNSFIIRIDRDNYKIPDIMKYSLIYLTTTVLLFFFGPISWKVKNPGIVIIYLVLYEIALGLGYKLGRYSKRAPEEKSINDHQNITEVEKVKINRLIVIGIVFDLLMVVRMANTFNLSIIFQKVFNGLNSPAAQYKAYYEEATAGNLYGGSLFSLFITLGAPFCIAGIILGIFYFKDLKTSGKSLCVLLIIIHLSSKLISSANEGIFDTVLYIVVSMFLRVTNESLTKVRKPSTNTRKKVFFIILAVSLISVALVYFTNNIMGRTLGNFTFGTLGENKYDPNAEINKYIPEPLMVTFVYLTAYLCEGYYGFSLTTLVPWVPTWGTGFSSFIRNNLTELFGYDFFQLSYQKRIESVANWGALKNFHSAYTFWANDVSRFGVIFVMLFIGYKLARYYYDSVVKCKATSIIMMPLLVTLILYLPLNNKIFAQPASFLLILYILIYEFAKKRNIVLWRK